jgi:type I restriction enzyme S subunit
MITEKFKTLFDFAPKSGIKAGNGLEEGNFPFYTSSSILSKRIDKALYNDEALIFGTGGSASIHFAGEPFSTSTDCIVAITKSQELNAKFVYYYLLGNIHILERGFKGAGLKHTSKKYIENIDIPVLPFETQNKIVAVLDKASSLVSKRNDTIKLLNDLHRATFIDLFGDPVINLKNWDLFPLSKIGTFSSGGTPSKENSAYWQGTFPWISPKDMKSDYLNDSINHISEIVFKETSLKKIETKSILIVVRGMILAHSFPVAINNIPVAINQDMKAILPSENYLPEYLLSCLQIMKDWILQYVSTAAHGTKKLNADSLEKIMIPCPPMNNQIVFKDINKKYLKTRDRLFKGQNEIKNLHNSILQKVFNGELNFNIDIELDALIKEIDLQKKENDLSKIITDFAYLQRLIDRLNSQEFKERDLYDKAKHAVFQLLRENNKIAQEYDGNSKSLKLALK